MIYQSFLAVAVLAAPVLAADAPEAPASAPPRGTLELSHPICMNGKFAFHFKTDGATEGNVAIPLAAISRICRDGPPDDDAPQPQRMPKEPLPKADNV